MRGFGLMIFAGIALLSSGPTHARSATHPHRGVASHFGAAVRIGDPDVLRGSTGAGAISRQYDAGAHTGGGWHQPGWGGTLNPGWGYNFGPRLGGSGL